MKLNVSAAGVTEMAARMLAMDERVRAHLKRAAYRTGEEAKSDAVRRARSAAATTPSSTAVRTGALWRSYRVVPKEVGRGVQVDVGVLQPAEGEALKYAAIHEYGGSIGAQGGKYLAIPLPDAKTAKGVARGGPRDYTDTYVWRGPSGKLIISQRVLGEKPLHLFVLQKRIDIKARPSITHPAVIKKAARDMEASALRAVREAFTRAA